MNENLNKLLAALQVYLDAETPDRVDHIRSSLTELDLSNFIETYNKVYSGPITNARAAKLRENLKSHKKMSDFHYDFQIRKSVIPEILAKFKTERKLVWDIIELPADKKGNSRITFALGAEGSDERMLVLDVDQTEDITKDFPRYQQNFEESSALVFDECFVQNGFSKKNTRTVYIQNDESFTKLCESALNGKNNELFLETCIVSFDLIDLITGVSPYNFFNCGQFSFFEKVTDDSGKIIFSNLTTDLNQDVNPTRPPY
ncbi:hypothetical protein [Chryseobacterium bernardetii]|uniref:hypothetical protein n=1 Tax=Chryseobacterium bernardetii TaxID=1241978 RepID=UPI003AF86F67